MAYKQHFVEWFSGKGGTNKPNFAWDRTVNGATATMVDDIDGGFGFNITASGQNIANHFNNKTQYSGTSSTFISVLQAPSSSATLTQWGLVEDKANIGLLNGKSGYIFGISVNAHYCYTANGTRGNTNMSTTVDGNAHSYKAVRAGSNCKFYYDGVLNVTRTDYLPTVALQPAIRCEWSGSAETIKIRYMEAYNT